MDKAPVDQQPALREVRDVIVAALPKADEELGSSDFPVYTIAGRWIAGFATRKKGPMLYIMVGEVMAHHAGRLGKLVSGKSCIEYRATKDLEVDQLARLARQMLAEAAQAVG